jgi:dinuclear metal center YbgI/SA1388 family protein
MKLKEITDYLEHLFPLNLQESYDNSGLLIGDINMELRSVLICLDSTEEIVDEAIRKGANLIVAHHPIIFSGLKSLTEKNYVERVVIRCIQNNIALYAIHTNLDNHQQGVNAEIAERIGLKNCSILRPKVGNLYKLQVFLPLEALKNIDKALFEAGAGEIGKYSECHFHVEGTGTFKANQNTNPVIGKRGVRSSVAEYKVEYLVPLSKLQRVLRALRDSHPYEEIAYDIIPIMNKNQNEGAGLIGELEKEMDEKDFLFFLKTIFKCDSIRHTKFLNKPIKRIALCGGSGSFLLKDAIKEKATVFISGDFKYHDFFDADNQIVIADIGHYESEQFTTNLIADRIKEKFTNFVVHLTEINTNPINYF